MKGLLSILLLVFSVTLFAQDRTVDLTPMGAHDTYVKYTGVAADTLTSNQDTLDIEFEYRGDYVYKVAALSEIDTIAGADTLTVELLGYDFEDDATAATLVAASTVNAAEDGEIEILVDDYEAAAAELSFRRYVLRYIRTGTGGGLEIKKAELKLYP